jgi:hypothetical protein
LNDKNLDNEMYNRIFWNTRYSQSGIPIELKLAWYLITFMKTPGTPNLVTLQ